jgi:Ca2+-binding EF-hand superfamily protein
MSSLTSEELNQLSEETGLSQLSIQDWYKHFQHECPTGSISKERYINLYRSYYPRALNSDGFAQMFFTVFDDDHDQALNFREFLRIISITQGTDEIAKLEIAYKAYNRNQLETNLSRKHFQKALISILDLIETPDDNVNQNNKREKTIHWTMKCLGFDEKTEITKKEFIRICKDDKNLYDFLAFYSVSKPNCSDGDLYGKEKYKILIKTKTGIEGNTSLSTKLFDTNANVFLILHGENIDSESIQLQQSQTHKNPFEYGHTDIFTQFLPPLGEIKGATLWHLTDDKHQGWFVEDLLITNETLNTTTYFPIQSWLDTMTKVELIPNQPPSYVQ